MSPKTKGARNERRSRALLEAAGYGVTRSGGSLGVWDLIGLSATEVVCVQVKTRDWPGRVEMRAIREAIVPPNARKLIHRWRKGARAPGVREVK